MKRKVEGMGGIVFLSDDLVHHNLTGILSPALCIISIETTNRYDVTILS